MNRLIRHVRSNAIAYLALFVALGGTSYAAINLPANSVGSRQLKNGSVTPRKLDPQAFGGSLRHWAFVNYDGHVIGGSRGAKVWTRGGSFPYYVSWGDRFSHSCAVLATSPGQEGFAPFAQTVGVHVNQPASSRGETDLWIWPSSDGTFVRARFYVIVIC